MAINVLKILISTFIFIINQIYNKIFKAWCLGRKYDVCFNYRALNFLREVVKNFKL